MCQRFLLKLKEAKHLAVLCQGQAAHALLVRNPLHLAKDARVFPQRDPDLREVSAETRLKFRIGIISEFCDRHL